ncbi:hypothetical protein C1H21_20155 [Xanthomonas arboricola pv. juglandis]|nr:hypothetical protein C1H21_20155 [Xanthomonas arboricola pv. juglandis]
MSDWQTTLPIARWAQPTALDLRPGCRALARPARPSLCAWGVVLDSANGKAAERRIGDLAARSLPAHRRGTRRKYVRVGSYAASMPRKVPRR